MKLKESLLIYSKKKGWSLSRLAMEAGVPVQTLHGWTAGRKPVNLEQLKKISQVLEISLHQLVFGTPDPYESLSDVQLKHLFSGDVRITIHRISKKK